MSWDLQALLILVVLAGLGLIVPPLLYAIKRAIGWRRVREYRDAYLPQRFSGMHWRENRRI